MAKQIIEKQFFGSIAVQNITFKLQEDSDIVHKGSKGSAFSIIIPHSACILQTATTAP